MLKVYLNDNIKHWVKHFKISRMAKKMGVSRQTLIAWQSGKQGINMVHRRELISCFSTLMNKKLSFEDIFEIK